MKKFTLVCNLCGTNFTHEQMGEVVGIEWYTKKDGEALRDVDPTEANHHICRKCLRQVHDLDHAVSSEA